MAKQKGIHQLRGKVGDMAYYTQKGVEGGLARSINAGLSDRVKNDAAYENTRLNASEFGTAGSFAGACIRSIAERKRAMMKDFATGDLAKVVRSIVLADSTHAWGSRQFVGTDWQGIVRDKINQYAKLPWGTYVQGSFVTSVVNTASGYTHTLAYSFPENWGSLLAAKGANGVDFETYAVGVRCDTSTPAPFRSVVYVERSIPLSATLGEAKEEEQSVSVAGKTVEPDSSNYILFGLCIAKPYKLVGGQKYTLQELCTYLVIPVSVSNE